jgi:hypothetical protein
MKMPTYWRVKPPILGQTQAQVDGFLIIFPSFSHPLPIIFPSFSHPFPILFPSFSHHFPIIFPSFFPSFSHHFPIIFPILFPSFPPSIKSLGKNPEPLQGSAGFGQVW